MQLAQLFSTKRQLFSYVTDYLVIIISVIAFGALDKADPHHQPFSLKDINIQYPYAIDERVSAAQAGIIAVLFPLVVLVIWSFTAEGRIPLPEKRRLRLNERLWELNLSVLSLGLSVGIALVATDALKNTVGRPRPDLLSRCIVRAGSADASVFGLSTSEICAQTDEAILRDGFKSFPSGHSSISFSGLGLLAFWLAGKLKLMDGKGQIWKVVAVMIPIFAATLVAVSRIMDKRHHAFDVIFGSALGIICAWVAYRQYFPSLVSKKAGIAYGQRSFGRVRVPYGASRDISSSRSAATAERPPTLDRDLPLQHIPHGTGQYDRGYAQLNRDIADNVHKDENVV